MGTPYEKRPAYEPARVEVEAGAPLELAYRAALLCGVAEQHAYLGFETRAEPERLEGIRMPWRHFRLEYDYSAANPVGGGALFGNGKPAWSEAAYPRPRKPGVVYQWSGAWNSQWRAAAHSGALFVYELWTIEWRRQHDEPHLIDAHCD